MKSIINKLGSELLDKYLEILEKNRYKSSEILVLVENNLTRLEYINKIKVEICENFKICTYSSFVKEEISKYWYFISTECEYIEDKKLSPTFISGNLKTYIFEKSVGDKRNHKNYFQEITGTNKSIAASIVNNLDHALYNDIDYKKIGKRLYESKKDKDNLNEISYKHMDEVVDEYIKIMLKNSLLDDSISVYLYNRYLLKNEVYLEQLLDRYNYLLVDDLQNRSVSEMFLIDIFERGSKQIYLYLDYNRYFSSFIKNDFKYIRENILEDCEFYSNKNIFDLANMPCRIEFDQSSQLYSEMIQKIVQKIKNLIDRGYNKKDICIITPINTPELDYEISNELRKYNIEVLNTKKDSKIIDYPYGNLLYVAICIFCELEREIKPEEFINFIQLLFGENRIKSTLRYKNMKKDEDIIALKKYIEVKRSEGLTIGEFLVKFYIEKVLALPEGRKNVEICKNIISESEIFEKCLEELNLENSQEIFVVSLKKFIKDYFAARELYDIKNEDTVLIATAFSYIFNRMKKENQIWVDIGSNSWNMKIERELSNPLVFKKSFEEGSIYTDEIEEAYKKFYLNNTVYNLLKSCKNVYAFKSDYSINGYLQESALYSLIIRLIEKGDEGFEQDKL